MKIIAHRGLLDGPNKDKENTPTSIQYCLDNLIDTEIDIWYENGQWLLGHDYPQYQTNLDFISQKGLWIHAKNFEAADMLSSKNLVFFWHENDERTLTSNGYWWTFPQKNLGKNSIALMPEWYIPLDQIRTCLTWNCMAICTDYWNLLK